MSGRSQLHSRSETPKNWPATVRYIQTSDFHTSITRTERSLLLSCLRRAATSQLTPAPSCNVVSTAGDLVGLQAEQPSSACRHVAAPRNTTPKSLGSQHNHGGASSSFSNRSRPPQLHNHQPKGAPRVTGCPPRNNVVIKPIVDPAHPACGQFGLFAARNLEPCCHILDYVGLMTSSTKASTTSDYTLKLTEDVALDAEAAGNEARFINDYRGVRNKPNVQFDNYVDASTGTVHMGVFALGARIKKGEELCVTYGKGFWQARGLLSWSAVEAC